MHLVMMDADGRSLIESSCKDSGFFELSEREDPLAS